MLFDAVIRVDPAWKMNTALGLFCASRVTVPVRPSAEAAVYTPGAMVCPPRSLDTAVAGVRPAASLYPVVRSDLAWSATASAVCWVPLITSPGGKPLTAVPGLTPRSPEMIEGPVLVTVVPASTPKDVAVPNPTEGWAAYATGVPTTSPKITMAVVPTASTTADQRRRRTARTNWITDVTDSTSSTNTPADHSQVLGWGRGNRICRE